MKIIKLRNYALLSILVFAFVTGCSTVENNNGIKYVEGYYIVNMPYSFDKVYSSAYQSIKAGETYTSTSGAPYNLVVNKKTNETATLEGINPNDPRDTIKINIKKISDTSTSLAIKYGKDGNSMRSSAEVQIIEGNIKYD
ncbi:MULTISPECIES: DUF3568 family protein [Francisella]|uniref:DUF3568 family protein n=2 Tax=Francisella TaxID=262 RepID=A0ABX5ZGN0_9GAMM|nr:MULTISPECIES: DUF3568 family protein [Francisella]AEI35867.1 hypothetical protein F7308_0940 [Francisella salina]QEO57370.1 DUF3568 family protein [Francisella marina]QEO58514.1 DUF3568 family protein [Francisella marina]